MVGSPSVSRIIIEMLLSGNTSAEVALSNALIAVSRALLIFVAETEEDVMVNLISQTMKLNLFFTDLQRRLPSP